MLRLSGLNIYPVKGMRGVDLDSAAVEPWGLAHDRRWLVADPQGKFMTQRQEPRMALLQAHVLPRGIRLSLPDLGTIDIPSPTAEPERIEVEVWRDRITAVPAGPEADRWLSAALGAPYRLVYMANPERARPVDPNFALADETVSFADGFPMLVTTEASLADLNQRMDRPVPMNRFRPNLVLAGGAAWAEDGWRTLRVGAVEFRVAKECARCVVTTIDQTTGEKSPLSEPLRTLATFRRKEGGVMFGQNLVPNQRGVLLLGDPAFVTD